MAGSETMCALIFARKRGFFETAEFNSSPIDMAIFYGNKLIKFH